MAMTGAALRRNRIALDTRSIAARYMYGISTPPTDLDALAHTIGIKEIVSGDIAAHGELRRVGRSLQVILARNQSSAQRAFTLAHELAHAVLDAERPRTRLTMRDLERACDQIAAEFLMPADVFRRDAGERPDLARMRRLAERYRASLVATALRCAEVTNTAVFLTEGARLVSRRQVTISAAKSILRIVGTRGVTEANIDFGSDGGARRVQTAQIGQTRLWILVPRTIAEQAEQRVLLALPQAGVLSFSVPDRPSSPTDLSGTSWGEVRHGMIATPAVRDRALWRELRALRTEWTSRSTCLSCQRDEVETHNATRVWREAASDLTSALVAADGRVRRDAPAHPEEVLMRSLVRLATTWRLEARGLDEAKDVLDPCRGRILARASHELEERTQAASVSH